MIHELREEVLRKRSTALSNADKAIKRGDVVKGQNYLVEAKYQAGVEEGLRQAEIILKLRIKAAEDLLFKYCPDNAQFRAYKDTWK